MNLSLAPLLLVLLSLLNIINTAPLEDQVTFLPGLQTQPNFKHYSGYLNATGTKKLHYWFVESASNPSTDPVVLWLNGGPGCSSMDGMLSEHGPFQVQRDGQTIKMNKYSWNNVANMLYLEAPAGVGYSYSLDKNYNTDDDKVSNDNHIALQHFFMKFPEFKENNFFITGESYGGIYVPTLSARIVDDPSFNFKGFAVGNGLSSSKLNENSIVYFGYYHGLIGQELWTRLITACCKGNESRCDFTAASKTIEACGILAEDVQKAIYGGRLNMYNLYGKCYGNSLLDIQQSNGKMIVSDLSFLFPSSKLLNKHKQTLLSSKAKLQVVPPCIDASGITKYLNNVKVRSALHIPTQLPEWGICSAIVGVGYQTLYNNMKQQYLKVLSTGKQRILVYNGDVDMACNFLGDEWFVDELDQEVTHSRTAWFYSDSGSKQNAGFVKQFKNIDFVTIRGAGHMVPQDKPVPALKMFENFINNIPY